MSLTRQDITICEGTDFQWQFDIVKLDGTPFDLTPLTDAKIDIRPYANSPILYLHSVLNTGITIPTPANGKIIWTITNVNTLAMGFLEAWYDLKLIISGNVYRPGCGLVAYSRQVTV